MQDNNMNLKDMINSINIVDSFIDLFGDDGIDVDFNPDMYEPTYYDEKQVKTNSYTLSIPDDFVIDKDVEGRDFVAYLPTDPDRPDEDSFIIKIYSGLNDDNNAAFDEPVIPDIYSEMALLGIRLLNICMKDVEYDEMDVQNGSIVYAMNYKGSVGYLNAVIPGKIGSKLRVDIYGCTDSNHFEVIDCLVKILEEITIDRKSNGYLELVTDKKFLEVPLSSKMADEWRSLVKTYLSQIMVLLKLKCENIHKLTDAGNYSNDEVARLFEDAVVSCSMVYEKLFDDLILFAQKAASINSENSNFTDLKPLIANIVKGCSVVTLNLTIDGKPLTIIKPVKNVEKLKNAWQLTEINEESKYFESNRKSVETDDFDYDREYDSIDSLLKAYVDYFEKMVKDWEDYCTYVRNQLDETIFNPFKTSIDSINDFKNEIKNTRDNIGEIYVKIAENLCVKAEALCKTTDRYSEIISVYSFLKMVIEKMEDLNLEFKLEEIETNTARTLSGSNYECPRQMQDLTIKWAEIVLRTPEGRIIKSKIEEKDEILKKIDLEFTKWPELARKLGLEIYTGESDMIERNNKFQKEMDDILDELSKKDKDLEKIPGIYFVQRNGIKKQIKVLEDDLSEKKKLYMEMVDEYKKTLYEKEKEIKTFIKMKEDISSELERLGWKE